MKNLIKTGVAILFFILAAAGILIAVKYLDREPSTLLKSTECTPPCWYGIYPGKTNSSKVYAILDRLNGVNKNSIIGDYNKDDTLSSIFWYFQRPEADNTGTVYFDRDRVTAITILAVNSLKLGDIFEKIGEPDEYWAGIGEGDQREYLEVLLLYPVKGVLVEVVIDIAGSANQVKIQAATPVYRVTYFAPELYQELLGTRILIDKSNGTHIRSPQPWPGFGNIPIDRK